MKIVNNIIERRAECNRDLYKGFYLKYLNASMRELIWKGLLTDGILLREIAVNFKNNKQFSIPRDERAINPSI